MKQIDLLKFINGEQSIGIGKLVDIFENELLKYDGFPSEYLQFINTIFSNEKLFNLKDTWKFIHSIDTEDLKSDQVIEVVQTLTKNYPNYRNEMLCVVTCDYIARNLDAKVAFNFFLDLHEKSNTSLHIGQIVAGLDILLNNFNGSNDFRKKIHETRKKLWDELATY